MEKERSINDMDNNSFCIIFSEEANISVRIEFIDLLFLKPENIDYYIYSLFIYDSNEKDLLVSKEKINSELDFLDLNFKKKIYDSNCFYQYFKFKIFFMSKKKTLKSEKIYIIPLYFKKKNYIYALYYGMGNMSLEIIFQRDTEKQKKWIKEPELIFLKENRFITLKSKENFEKNSPKKRFLFMNIQAISSFPNLNLKTKYEFFHNREEEIDYESHLAIYLTESFDHLGLFVFQKNDLNENIINFPDICNYYSDLQNIKEIIQLIKISFSKGCYDFYDLYPAISVFISNNFPIYLKKIQRKTISFIF